MPSTGPTCSSPACCLVRSSAARTRTRRIVSIDVAPALAVPGVRAVITRDDLLDPAHRTAELGEGAVDIAHLSRNCMAREKVLYKGHVVAAVAADDIHTAEEAARLIRVEYEVLPPVLSALDAMKADAPILLERLAHSGDWRRQDRGARRILPAISATKRGTWTKASLRRLSSSSRVSTRRPCIRGISSRTTRRPIGMPTGTSPSGRARRAPSPHGISSAGYSASPSRGSRLCRWRSAAGSVVRLPCILSRWPPSSRKSRGGR